MLLASAITLLWWVGFRPNTDVDDIMKLHELRKFLATGSLFDRTIPGVLQPEPMVSHWPWIVDAPYALVTLALNLALPLETALYVATLIVPPLLLIPVVWLLDKIIRELGFTNRLPVLALSAFAALLSATEFQPGRIDYHNLQMVVLAAIVLCAMREGRRAAMLCGVFTAISLAFSAELAGFLALAAGIYAVRFIVSRHDSDGELRALGLGLVPSALVLYLLVNPPSAWGAGYCDRYSSVHLVALAGAGICFMALGSLQLRSPLARSIGLAIGAALSLAVIGALFPLCFGGPYAGLSAYVQENWLAPISQDASILATPDFGRSPLIQLLMPAFVGLGAAIAFAFGQRPQSRAWVVYGLFAGAIILQMLLAPRFMRLAPLMSGPGLALALAALLPSTCGVFGRPFLTSFKPSLAVPGIVLIVALMALPSVIDGPQSKVSGVMLAEDCAGDPLPKLLWPPDNRILAPPGLGIGLLGPATNANVIAVPFHTAAAGIERAYRFFDPATASPQAVLADARATHVTVCAATPELAERFAQSLPLAAALASSSPPAWLKACGRFGPLHVYSVSADIGCPLPAK